MSRFKLGLENAVHAGTGGRSQATLVSGFERNGYFYTRAAAARAAAEWTQ